MDHFDFSDESEDKLRRVTWTFWLYGRCLVLDAYTIESRPSRRHSYKTESMYQRIAYGSAIPQSQRIAEADVPLTPEIQERALRQFMASLRVVRWDEIAK